MPVRPPSDEVHSAKTSLLDAFDDESLSSSESSTAKAAELLARRIEAEVVKAGWPVGEHLGTEPELIEQFQVSRSVMREAIRLLEHHMVARMRSGPGGGLIVTKPDPSIVTRAAALYLDYRQVEPRHLHSARSALEVKCLELATERISEAGQQELRDVIDDEAQFSPSELIQHSHEFHLLLARLAQDPSLELLLGVLLQLTGDHAPPPDVGVLRAGNDVYRSRDAHAAIAKAICQREPELATALMLEHLEWVTTGLEDHEGSSDGREH